MSKPEYRIRNKQLLSGKKILVMGLGRFGGGVDAAKFAAKAGGKVVITDLGSAEKLSDSVGQLGELGDIEYHLGGHRRADFEEADIIVVNPAVAADSEFVRIARQGNKLLTSQINIFFELCPARIIGITGANGKSTTAALTAHLLKAGRGQKQRNYGNVWLSGNIGNEPLLVELDKIEADDLVVLELSSFQLEQSAWVGKAPKVALLTNLTPNHLDRHGTFVNYCSAKENIFKYQKPDGGDAAISIFNGEDNIGAEWFEKYKEQSGRVCMKFCADEVSEEIRGQFGLAGRANLSNLAAAITIARHFGVEEAVMKDCLSGFKPLPHRLELVAFSGGVCWYNDSIATTPASAIAALEV
ncbi:MAG: UDP-N-acetylmuramoyl-L-alanine--D-glutamate ligase [Planctomycetota bacterium]|jgi:UDP-N-acetylmuramoylalanine--D-glutamate ligase